MDRVIDWLFRDRTTGRIVVAQAPNLPLVVFVVARLAAWILDPAGTAGTALDLVGTAALLWWAGDEVIRGVNPFRRILGATVAALTVASLVW